ncbi:hypothetical protein DLAC_06543 [Tieghemostelium lacteum]|uniref:Tubulin-tyrosine ligase family protein n=1 Tax=Tieghemostelium lacteum TaxID=361077 RepID=A0A151ZF03_TIELA|nr:hypothetical protein DLAC_06543 [Tieghemostelium lacteum]|eukprot:KYQ92552.1 hypothetical protein DLAC_06543 [Tieghemostelium lacteum]
MMEDWSYAYLSSTGASKEWIFQYGVKESNSLFWCLKNLYRQFQEENSIEEDQYNSHVDLCNHFQENLGAFITKFRGPKEPTEVHRDEHSRICSELENGYQNMLGLVREIAAADENDSDLIIKARVVKKMQLSHLNSLCRIAMVYEREVEFWWFIGEIESLLPKRIRSMSTDESHQMLFKVLDTVVDGLKSGVYDVNNGLDLGVQFQLKQNLEQTLRGHIARATVCRHGIAIGPMVAKFHSENQEAVSKYNKLFAIRKYTSKDEKCHHQNINTIFNEIMKIPQRVEMDSSEVEPCYSYFMAQVPMFKKSISYLNQYQVYLEKLFLFVLVLLPLVFSNDDILKDNKKDTFSENAQQLERLREIIKNRKKVYLIDQLQSNHTLIKDALESRGYVKGKLSNFDFKWTWSWDMAQITSDHQVINHFPNFEEIGSKKGLTLNIQYYYNNQTSIEIKNVIERFFPRSYELSNENQRNSFIEDFKRFSQKSISNDILLGVLNTDTHEHQHGQDTDKNILVYPRQPEIDGKENIWIVKPASNARGVGIEIFSDLDKILSYSSEHKHQMIVQKYIEKPFTVHQRKFDIRQFVLVTSLNPLEIFMFQDCYLRFCSIDYTTENLQDRFIHLSNHQVQKEYLKAHENESSNTLFPHNQWPLKTFKQFLINSTGKNEWDLKIKNQIEQLIIHTVKSWPSNGHRNNSFELLGFDILLDENMNPYLLEVNTNPGLHLLTDVVNVHHKEAVDDLFKVVLDFKSDIKKFNSNQWILKLSDQEKLKLFGKWNPIYVGQYDPTVVPLTRESKFNYNTFDPNNKPIDPEKMKETLLDLINNPPPPK